MFFNDEPTFEDKEDEARYLYNTRATDTDNTVEARYQHNISSGDRPSTSYFTASMPQPRLNNDLKEIFIEEGENNRASVS